MDFNTLLIVGVVVGLVAWVLAFRRGLVVRADVGRGLLHGLVVGAAMLAVVTLLSAVFFTGREFLGGVVDLGPAIGIGLFAGLVIGGLYFLAGLALMPIGLLLRGTRDWALYGTWVAVVIVIVSVGLGFTAYSAFQADNAPPGPTPAPTRPPAS